MEYIVKSDNLQQLSADALLVCIDENGNFDANLNILDELSEGFFTRQKNNHNLPQKNEQAAVFYDVANLAFARVVVWRGTNNIASLRKAIDNIFALANGNNWETLLLALPFDVLGAQLTKILLKQITHCHYRFEHFKSKKNISTIKQWQFLVAAEQAQNFKLQLNENEAWSEALNLTRDLANTPPNVCTPNYLAEQALRLEQQHSELQVNIFKKKEIKELNMGALLAVAQGSANSPRFITMEYNSPHASNQKPVVLVGKGVTFDTGGISLKPAAAMDEMKYDMCGAATLFGVMKALCMQQLPVHVVAIVAAVENMPDGAATRPGDIVTSMSGKTVEILNTDAEGRLILCDALTYAQRYQPMAVIDLATLTGACIIALGNHRAALLGNDDLLCDALFAAGELAQDPVWKLPLDKEYKDLLNSRFADLPNISSARGAGTITAAAFLSEFTQQYAWAHLDIAGVAWLEGKQKGATGRPLGLLLEYLHGLTN